MVMPHLTVIAPIVKDPARRFAWGVSIACCVIAVIGLGLFYAAVIDRTAPVKDLKGRVTEVIKRPDGSHLMIVQWTGVRTRFCSGNSQRWLMDGIVMPLPDMPTPPTEINEKAGDKVVRNIAVEVPAMFHKIGSYRIRTSYQCNVLQQEFPRSLSVIVDPPPVPFDLNMADKEDAK